jgi:heterodisulfide reductase subunit A-like polyferredoxin
MSTGAYVCHCCENISELVDVKAVAVFTKAQTDTMLVFEYWLGEDACMFEADYVDPRALLESKNPL